MLSPDGVKDDTHYFKTDEIKQTCSFLDKAHTICVSSVRNKENEFHRGNPIVHRVHHDTIIFQQK